ncbi:MAG: hypothetical protein NW226_26385 [Microscillaceae bacterium]|nr:hypothetical protein [Microscillaceae bacterium]
MKTISFLPFALLMLLAFDIVFAQCDPEFLKQKGIKKLSEESGYTFLKSYVVDDPKGKKYSYIFSQGANYMITLANYNPDNKGVYITIYDSNNQKIASSFTEGKFFPAIAFTCHRTGIYQMHFSFEDTNKFCAAGVLGMKR